MTLIGSEPNFSMFNAFHRDAFSHGQILSKLWLCNELERLLTTESQTIWVYGGWYCLTNFLLRSRQLVSVKNLCSFDIDPDATTNARIINNTWECEGTFRAFTYDCNTVDPSTPWLYESEPPDIIINTATEHFDKKEWFNAIPSGTRVILQSNDLAHDDHVGTVALSESVDALIAMYPLRTIEFSGNKPFRYPQMSYDRYMVIGRK